MASLFRELKRRNVYKVAAAYAVVGWLLFQLKSILFPTFEAPSWVMKPNNNFSTPLGSAGLRIV